MKIRFWKRLARCLPVLAVSGLIIVSLPGCQPRTSPTPTVPSAKPPREPDFQSLFDGQSLAGWKLVNQKGDGYGVTNGVIYCAKGGGGNLMTEKQYENFILRFEFKLEVGTNNGLGIRAPLQGDAA